MISASMKVVLTYLLLVYTALIITLSVKLTVVLMNILWVIFMSRDTDQKTLLTIVIVFMSMIMI